VYDGAAEMLQVFMLIWVLTELNPSPVQEGGWRRGLITAYRIVRPRNQAGGRCTSLRASCSRGRTEQNQTIYPTDWPCKLQGRRSLSTWCRGTISGQELRKPQHLVAKDDHGH
jgi:hypothetical protein